MYRNLLKYFLLKYFTCASPFLEQSVAQVLGGSSKLLATKLLPPCTELIAIAQTRHQPIKIKGYKTQMCVSLFAGGKNCEVCSAKRSSTALGMAIRVDGGPLWDRWLTRPAVATERLSFVPYCTMQQWNCPFAFLSWFHPILAWNAECIYSQFSAPFHAQ